ncbi:hypothetical protein GJAV_G00147970 [Gymnothorax javanicus]|nr:hypothetical protein GJAV_G00147970 [Gymnothorax javanicus]
MEECRRIGNCVQRKYQATIYHAQWTVDIGEVMTISDMRLLHATLESLPSYEPCACLSAKLDSLPVTSLRWKALNNKDMFESSSGSSSRLGCVVTSRNNDCGSSA